MESSRDMIPEYVYSRQAEFENSEVYSRTIERRYQGEDQMLSYISQGNLKECLHIFQSSDGDGAPLNMDDVYHRYPDDITEYAVPHCGKERRRVCLYRREHFL